jgi:hypothetical protein
MVTQQASSPRRRTHGAQNTVSLVRWHKRRSGVDTGRRAPGRFGLPVGRADHPRRPCLRDHAGQPMRLDTSAQAKQKARYAARAGVEGTMRQATHVT